MIEEQKPKAHIGRLVALRIVPIIVIVGVLIFIALRYDFYSYWILLQTTYPLIAQVVLVAIIWIGAVYAGKIGIDIYNKLVELVEEIPARMNMLIHKVIRYGIYVVAVILTLGVFGLIGAIQGLLVGAGFAGIVIGLAAQQTISNMISGVSLIFDKPFKLGDWINLKDKGIVGSVTSISLRSTTLISPDNTPINLPNSMIDKSAIINYSTHQLRRLFLKIGIAYESDVGKAIKTIQEVLENDSATAKAGIPGEGYFAPVEVVVTNFGESSVDLEAKVFVDTAEAGGLFETESRIRTNVMNKLTEAGIEIPYPKHSVILTQKG